MTITGTFTSVWENSGVIETSATLDISTGELDIESVEMDDDDDFLEEEYFTDADGNVYEVCQECHTHILETQMVPSIGKTLIEIKVCQNCGC